MVLVALWSGDPQLTPDSSSEAHVLTLERIWMEDQVFFIMEEFKLMIRLSWVHIHAWSFGMDSK